MKSTDETVRRLFHDAVRYVIPVFQRNYVWSPDHWSKLWEDVQRTAEDVIRARAGGKNVAPIRPHFLGAVILDEQRRQGARVNVEHVIDGQQRLTTLQLLLHAVHDLAVASEVADVADYLQPLLKNKALQQQTYEAYKLWPVTEHDQKSFGEITTAGSLEEVQRRFPTTRGKYKRKDDPNHPFHDAYVFFFASAARFVFGDDDEVPETPTDAAQEATAAASAEQRVLALAEAVSEYFTLVCVHLEAHDDAQSVFASLNGGGVHLKQSDLVRNFVFLEASQSNEDEHLSSEDLFTQHWMRFGTEKWTVMQKQGRLRHARFDLFLFHFLAAKTGRTLPISHLYASFKDWWREQPRDVAATVRELNRYADAYDAIASPDDDARLAAFMTSVRATDTSTVYPVLLVLLVDLKETLSVQQRDQILDDLESYLVRRLVCNLSTKNYNRTFTQVVALLKDAQAEAPESLRAHLLSLTGSSTLWPDDGQLELAWLTQPIYARLKGRTHFLLRRIEHALRNNKQEGLNMSVLPDVEHILPQVEAEKLVVPESLSTYGITALTLVHSFGNLTLLSQHLNRSLGARAFEWKRPQIVMQSEMRLNTYFQKFEDQDPWGSDEILERGRVLLQTAKKVWPYPAS